MKKVILLAILVSALFLRLIYITQTPALNADEAAIGYNAYSLLLTGKDEHANSWPITFQSFNDYKPGLYFYLVFPFVRFLGLTVLSVRLPSVILGALCTVIMYLFVKELLKDSSYEKGSDTIALIAALFVAISPWHIHFSRGGWEVNVADFFILCGLWLLLKSVNTKKTLMPLFLSSIFFVMSLYTYHAPRIVVPLLLLGFVILYRKWVKVNIKNLVIVAIVALVMIIPILKEFTKGTISERAAGVSIFSDPGVVNRINEQRGEHAVAGSLSAILLHNKGVNYLLDFGQNWASHFWGEYLFLSGDSIQRDKVPDMGELYLFDFGLIVVGFYFILKKIGNWKILVWWLIVSPTASALTFQAPHALRSHNMLFPLLIISSFGLYKIIGYINKLKINIVRVLSFVILVSVIIWNFSYYLHMYYLHMAERYPFSSQYGMKELTDFVMSEGSKYSKIVVTDRYDQPYILFLFYLKYNPSLFQNHHSLTPRDVFGFSTVANFDKYVFKKINYDEDRVNFPNSLIVGTSEEIPKESNIVKKINFPNGTPAFEIVAN